MIQWQYMTLAEIIGQAIIDRMDAAGMSGWELVSSINIDDSIIKHYFKRQVEE